MKQTFHGFEIREKIGAGGMSTVYRGVHQTLGYPVAVKVLHPALAGDESFIARFEREARSASSLRSNNIATVIDFGTENDIYFIVMEFIDGPDLSQLHARLNEARERTAGIPAEIALILLEEAAYGLQEAHAQNIIHRDVKPSNVLINTKGEVKIADFGLARDTSKVSPLGQRDLTMPGMVVGTPSYMSPEQAVGNESIDHRTDVFSLGVVAYQLFSGRKPFTGAQPAEVQENIINQPPPPIEPYECPLRTPEIDQLLAKMLAKDPARRFQSMEQVRRGVQAAVDSIDVAGNIGRYRREYLKRFVADPCAFAEEMRQQNIADRLKRGYHYKEMGLSNIGDAVLEFNVVLALDPQNPKAAAALLELQRKAEESGVVFPAVSGYSVVTEDDDTTRIVGPDAAAPKGERETEERGDRTRVLAGAEAGEPATPPPSPPADTEPPPSSPWWKRPLPLAGGAVAVVAVAALLIGLLTGGDDTQVADRTLPGPATPVAAPTDTTAAREVAAASPADAGEPTGTARGEAATPPDEQPVAPSPEEEVAAPADAAPTAEPPATTPPLDAPPPVAAAAGVLALTSEPAGAEVYLRRPNVGDLERQGATPWEAELPAGRWEVRLELAGHVGRSYVIDVPADTRKTFGAQLDPVPTGPGWLKLVASPKADMYVDGELKQSDAKVAFIEVPGGRQHLIELRHPDIFGYHRVDDVRVASGETLQVAPHRFELASLSVGSRPWSHVVLDGRRLEGETPLRLDNVAAGRHRISAVRDGFRVTGAWLRTDTGRVPLQRLADADGQAVYRLDITRGQAASILFELSPEP